MFLFRRQSIVISTAVFLLASFLPLPAPAGDIRLPVVAGTWYPDSRSELAQMIDQLTARAQKKVLAYQLAEAMKAQKISKSEMARRMNTSRSQIDNLLNPDNNRFRIDTAQKAAAALGKTLIVGLV